MADKKTLTLGLSSCPNDTFIFHALLHGLSAPRLHERIVLEPYMADVERLNRLAMRGEMEISKISLGVVPHVLDKYRVLAAGGALGWGVGPLLVARGDMTEKDLETASIAIPGQLTTANLLLTLHNGFQGRRQEMLFSDIIPAVASGKCDLGLIIHEGRFTYKNWGLSKILDLGEWWEKKYKIPLPLGVIAIRRDVEAQLAKDIENAISESVQYAWDNPEASKEYIKAHAQELDDEVIKAHITTFVTSFSTRLDSVGKNAIEIILKAALKDIKAEDIFL